jgi:hypothetical protein
MFESFQLFFFVLQLLRDRAAPLLSAISFLGIDLGLDIAIEKLVGFN